MFSVIFSYFAGSTLTKDYIQKGLSSGMRFSHDAGVGKFKTKVSAELISPVALSWSCRQAYSHSLPVISHGLLCISISRFSVLTSTLFKLLRVL